MVSKRVYLFLTVMNVMPRWLQKMNMMLYPFAILSVLLVNAQVRKDEHIKSIEFAKKYRIVSKPIEFEVDGQKVTMTMVSIEKREEKQ